MAAPTDLPKMQYRFLGRSGLQVSCISLGGWLTYGGHVENENTFACMKAAYDAGINFFDCAEGYAGGESEKIMGECIKKFGWKRNDFVISTKINWGAANGDNPVNNGGLSRKHLVEGTRASLERLGLEYVDLLYAHRPDRNTPMEEIVRGFNYLIDTGKTFYWGISEWNADEIERANHVATRLNLVAPIMEQPQYNLLVRERCEKEYALLYEEYNLALTPFSPLKGGILTGKYNEGIPGDSRWAKSDDKFVKSMRERFGTDDWQAEVKKVASLKPIADTLGISQATLAMAWVLKNPHVASAITGASRPQQVWDSIRAIDAVPKLTEDVLKEIDQVLANKPAALTRRF
ncbi:Putative voltage-gated potassium channel subunit beta [Fulvia fulva]|uniref:Voltage-gated potassium channel subunit beta n=1 Tax=Passalora fulva TaxID=5499 RepID=A0A9Q8P995_PASFU|nr:Putative voltage-gated potassium channel subunit beta [Fulvia fulva]KAK4624522.1 putative voltage-gated potassium channel subunit beta [Fulvia fulva]KAK4625634.1 putative voltage-gated potassium channel subunit beta [Fulvia fulva]UJO17716.1 Putative voltage-gated potassium channel subunit beta [Fulvia fulva]WPV14783.1 Putative voltage-gated potassium channel subunit beta [Fulvia fulva]WPV30493.1 Putative voltage-gated potassium channel subunit beta [Fulvia fulva]